MPNHIHRPITSIVLTFVSFVAALHQARAARAQHPNIVVILSDDMGYGDPGCYNPDSQIDTPHIDRLAEEGMRFTDAHSPGSVCVPTRYGLLTGRYPFRASLDWRQRGVIESGRITVPSLLKQNGYQTAMVGKWHLGFDGGPDYDFAQPLAGGPLDRGFDFYFGIPHSLDIVPYYFIRNRRAIAAPTERIGAMSSPDWSPIQGKFWREGDVAPGFVHAAVLPRLGSEAVDWLDRYAKSESTQPFFLYVALTSPHTPWLPGPRFQGKSRAGLYGDFVMHTDDVVGQLLAALDRHSLANETLVLFTNDNGPIWYERDIERFQHRANLNLRGIKGDAWEGGHRVPFIVRWPGRVKAASVSDEMICQTDLLATVAALTDTSLPHDAGEDSFNLLPAWLGHRREGPIRDLLVTQSSRRVLAIRQGPWKLIPQLGSGGFSQPSRVAPAAGGPTGQLYNLSLDPAETHNAWSENPRIVKEMSRSLAAIQSSGRSHSAD